MLGILCHAWIVDLHGCAALQRMFAVILSHCRAECLTALRPAMSMCRAGIEEIAVEIEEPFGMLPLEDVEERARLNVSELFSKQFEIRSVTSKVRTAETLSTDGIFDQGFMVM